MAMRNGHRIILTLISSGALLAACSTSRTESPPDTVSVTTTSNPITTTTQPEGLRAFATQLQNAVTTDLERDPQLRAEIVQIRVRGNNLSAAAGIGDPQTGTPINPSASFRIASVTKTFVAAATLKLIEVDRFGVDDSIEPLIPTSLNEALTRGGYQPRIITVRQLLTHTSGIVDFTFGPGLDYVGQVMADPQRVWTRQDQVDLAMLGEPVAPPGTTYHYSDTGYALLGAIIEQATGDDLGASLRSLLDYEGLGLNHTYLELIEPAPEGQSPRAHQFFGELDTFDWSPTIDLFGGGGLVSTLDDLLNFFTALHEGNVFSSESSLELMHAIPETNTDVRVPGDPTPYAAGAGIFRSDLNGVTCWSHEGFWGVRVGYCPELDSGFALSISQATRSVEYNPELVGTVIAEAMTTRSR